MITLFYLRPFNIFFRSSIQAKGNLFHLYDLTFFFFFFGGGGGGGGAHSTTLNQQHSVSISILDMETTEIPAYGITYYGNMIKCT